MSRPSRETASGRVYLDLQTRARREGRPTDELFVLYVLERFLYRLSVSAHRDRLILKGGMLLAALGQRRPTRDVDLLALAISNDVQAVVVVVSAVLSVEVDDGVAFEPARLTADTIREQDVYTGVRIVVPARIHRAAHPLRIDVNVGDPVTPAPMAVRYPSLLGESFSVLGYPIETILAEKIVTMIDRGDATTRERDFADVVMLARGHEVDGTSLASAITATATHRQSVLRPLRNAIVTLGRARQADWARFRRRSGLENELPFLYEEAISRVAAFADPVLRGEATGSMWSAANSRWEQREDANFLIDSDGTE